MKHPLLAVLAITLCATPLTGLADQVYRWVDDEGVTHFTSHPPKGRPSETLRTQTGHSEPVDYSSQYPRPEPEQPEPQSAASNVEQPSKQELDEACQRARQNLETLERGGRIAVETEDGSRRYLGEEELSERAETARQIMDRAC
ncbi:MULTISPECIES: DUF4124 domain-containing protein [unclassified Marinimicrobium]|jgi:FtsZ-interacting cell division protein ZipA|uniref:DUF4124 domain-containing protein n=1 Tax=unclassified Marinimicrobium TaxID=2632100 RepID=UPI002579AE91|nr:MULTISPECIES: DUF4124 domain-containing protein [unclassified Marinimicrobium]